MKKIFTLALLMFALSACGSDEPEQTKPQAPTEQPTDKPDAPATPDQPDTPQFDDMSFARGADISWVTEQEGDGIKFYDRDGKEADCFQLMKAIGMNAVRLRVWVNPETAAQKDASQGGYGSAHCGKADVVAKAVRAWRSGLHVMIDFHYSDIFADPSRQATPTAWRGKSVQELCTLVAEHTKDVLTALKDKGITPMWIQIGNETRPGMLHPTGQLWDDKGDIPNGWNNYARLSNAGYDAAKAVCPEALVMVHIDNAWENNEWWFDKFRAAGGKMDMIGLSHYPMVAGKVTWQEANRLAIDHIKAWGTKYKVPVMVSEVGVKVKSADATQCIEQFMSQAKAIEQCAGAFYWEPQTYGNWRPSVYKNVFGWGAYDMGGFTDQGRPAAVLDSFAQ